MAEESIYNIIPKEIPIAVRQPRYRSRYPGDMVPTGSTLALKTTSKPNVRNVAGYYEELVDDHPFLCKYSTLGRPVGRITCSLKMSPDRYLKKGEGNSCSIFSLPKINHSKSQPGFKEEAETIKPSIPKIQQYSPLRSSPTRNYIRENVITSILLSPPKQIKELDWRQKRNYGKTPAYIQTIKESLQRESGYLKDFYLSQEAEEKQKMYEIPQEEIAELKKALKAKYDVIFHEYQQLTYLTKLDTMHKKRKQEGLEHQLSQIELDLQKLNKQHIFVDTHK